MTHIRNAGSSRTFSTFPSKHRYIKNGNDLDTRALIKKSLKKYGFSWVMPGVVQPRKKGDTILLSMILKVDIDGHAKKYGWTGCGRQADGVKERIRKRVSYEEIQTIL